MSYRVGEAATLHPGTPSLGLGFWQTLHGMVQLFSSSLHVGPEASKGGSIS